MGQYTTAHDECNFLYSSPFLTRRYSKIHGQNYIEHSDLFNVFIHGQNYVEHSDLFNVFIHGQNYIEHLELFNVIPQIGHHFKNSTGLVSP